MTEPGSSSDEPQQKRRGSAILWIALTVLLVMTLTLIPQPDESETE
jgi:hypothetical protein